MLSEDITEPSYGTGISRRFAPPSTPDLSAFVWTAGLLVGLLVAVVPALSVTTDVRPLVLVVGAGVVYGAVAVAAGRGFEGLASAVVVLSVFDLGVRVAEGPSIIPVTTASLSAVDFAIVPLLGVFVWYRHRLPSERGIGLGGRTLATVAFGVFVAWTILAGIVANGESSTVPLIYTVQFVRYALLLVLAALVVRATDVWCVVYPFVVTVGGNLGFALLQVLNRGGFGLKAFGETPTVILGSFTIGGLVQLPYGSYAGGFVGHSREFTLILLLFIPIVLAVATRHSWVVRLCSVVVAAAAVLVIRTADTDAGWAALILVGVLAVGLLGYAAVHKRNATVATGILVVGVAVFLTGTGLAIAEVLRATTTDAPTIPLFDTGSLPTRINQYVTAVHVASIYPLFGLGGGNFYLMGEDFGVPGLRGIHSIPFAYLAATGFVGATAYVLSIAAVLLIAFRRVLERTGSEQYLWAALVCGMVGFHAYSLWDLAHLWDSALAAFWLLCGVVIGASGDTRSSSSLLGDGSL